MRCEAEVQARVRAHELEMHAVSAEIATLTQRVKSGTEGWRVHLDALACCIERRRTLRTELESLSWVLSTDA